MLSGYALFFQKLRQKASIFTNLTVRVFIKRNYDIKISYIILFIIFIFVLGIFIGVYFSKLSIASEIFSANVFAAIILTFAFLYYKKKESRAQIISEKLIISGKIFELKTPFTEKGEEVTNEVIKHFNANVIYALHDLLLTHLLQKPILDKFTKFELEVSKDIELYPNRKLNLLIKNISEPVIERIYWFYTKPSLEEVKNYRILVSRLMILETDTIPGIFCRINDKKSADQIFKIKGRKKEKPLAIYSVNYAKYVTINAVAKAFITEFANLPLTIVLEASVNAPYFVVKDGFIGVRLFNLNHPFGNFLQKNNLELLGTSANLSGSKSPNNVNEISKDLLSQIPLFNIEGCEKEAEVGLSTSVIKIQENKLIILREGYEVEKIKLWGEKNGIKTATFANEKEITSYIINKISI